MDRARQRICSPKSTSFIPVSGKLFGPVLAGRLVTDGDVVVPVHQRHVGDLVDLPDVDNAELVEIGPGDKVVPLDQALLTAEMFVAFSKKSPCRSLAPDFGQGITELTTDGSFDKMLNEATAEWDKDQAKD